MLTWAERLILWNQYEILKSTDPGNANYHEQNQEIVAHGFEQFYPALNQTISETPVSREITSEVMDILDMYRAIHNSCQTQKYAPKNSSALFSGFDGNHEEQYAIAYFLRRTQGKWIELAARPDDSHSSSVPHYRRMLSKWQVLGKKHFLTPEEIEDIAGSD